MVDHFQPPPLWVKPIFTCVDSVLQLLFSFSHNEAKFGLILNVFRRLFITREIKVIDSRRSIFDVAGVIGNGGVGDGVDWALNGLRSGLSFFFSKLVFQKPN